MDNTATYQSNDHPPIPFTTYVVKVVSRCNLNCSYCYMYNLADRTYRDQPGVMESEVTAALANRISRHAVQYKIPTVHIILHGGEPLLMGPSRFRDWIFQMRSGLPTSVVSRFSIQSNGTLITDEWIELLHELGVGIGVSVDGPERFHDEFRVDHKGNGSFDSVVRGIRKLRSHRLGPEVFSTVMGVVNPDIPPSELFDFWQLLDVPGFDLSLPHANHLHPPRQCKISYGDWMVEFFDLWFDQNRADRHIRYFENIIRMIFQYPLSTDNIGGKPVGVVVVETNGGIEPTDAFKCCEDGITKLGLNVLKNDFGELHGIGMVSNLQHGANSLCEECQECELRDVCGGGYMPHRYSRLRKFDNPSVYCSDLKHLINHIRRRVDADIPESIKRRMRNPNA